MTTLLLCYITDNICFVNYPEPKVYALCLFMRKFSVASFNSVNAAFSYSHSSKDASFLIS